MGSCVLVQGPSAIQHVRPCSSELETFHVGTAKLHWDRTLRRNYNSEFEQAECSTDEGAVQVCDWLIVGTNVQCSSTSPQVPMGLAEPCTRFLESGIAEQ